MHRDSRYYYVDFRLVWGPLTISYQETCASNGTVVRVVATFGNRCVGRCEPFFFFFRHFTSLSSSSRRFVAELPNSPRSRRQQNLRIIAIVCKKRRRVLRFCTGRKTWTRHCRRRTMTNGNGRIWNGSWTCWKRANCAKSPDPFTAATNRRTPEKVHYTNV